MVAKKNSRVGHERQDAVEVAANIGAALRPEKFVSGGSGGGTAGVSSTATAIGISLALQSAAADGALAAQDPLAEHDVQRAGAGQGGERTLTSPQNADSVAVDASVGQDLDISPDIDITVPAAEGAEAIALNPSVVDAAFDTQHSALGSVRVSTEINTAGDPTNVATSATAAEGHAAVGGLGGGVLSGEVDSPKDSDGLLGGDGLVDDVLDAVIGEDGLIDDLLGEDGLVSDVIDVIVGEGGLLGNVLGSGGLVDGLLGEDGLVDGILGEDGLVDGVLDAVVGNDGLLGSVLGDGGLVDDVLGEEGVVDGVLDAVVGDDGLLGSVLGDEGLVGDVLGEDGLVDDLLSEDGVVGSVLGADGIVAGVVNAVAGGEGLQGDGGLVAGILGDDGVVGGVLDAVVGDDGILDSVLGGYGVAGGLLGDDGLVDGVFGEDGIVGSVLDEVVGDDGLLGGLLGGSSSESSDEENVVALDSESGSDGGFLDTLLGVATVGENELVSPTLQIGGAVSADVFEALLGDEDLLGLDIAPQDDLADGDLLSELTGVDALSGTLVDEGVLEGGGAVLSEAVDDVDQLLNTILGSGSGSIVTGDVALTSFLQGGDEPGDVTGVGGGGFISDGDFSVENALGTLLGGSELLDGFDDAGDADI